MPRKYIKNETVYITETSMCEICENKNICVAYHSANSTNPITAIIDWIALAEILPKHCGHYVERGRQSYE
jgi:hypothetical protein